MGLGLTGDLITFSNVSGIALKIFVTGRPTSRYGSIESVTTCLPASEP